MLAGFSLDSHSLRFHFAGAFFSAARRLPVCIMDAMSQVAGFLRDYLKRRKKAGVTVPNLDVQKNEP